MTYFGPHERTVVQGTDSCTCGSEWPCEKSAEGRWVMLRTMVALDVAEHGEKAAAYLALRDGAGAAIREARQQEAQAVLRYMDELEAKP